MDFLPANFQLPMMPFRSQLRVRHGTDRRTDRRRPSMHNAPTLWGRGITRHRQDTRQIKTWRVWNQEIKIKTYTLKLSLEMFWNQDTLSRIAMLL